MQVLVVDDSRVARRILTRFLSELGFSVLEAVDGRQGLQVLERLEHLALALVDWNMPEVDGLGFVRALRLDPTHSEVPVLMVASETELGQVRRALSSGVDEYLMKPLTREMLKEKLALLGLRPGEEP